MRYFLVLLLSLFIQSCYSPAKYSLGDCVYIKFDSFYKNCFNDYFVEDSWYHPAAIFSSRTYDFHIVCPIGEGVRHLRLTVKEKDLRRWKNKELCSWIIKFTDDGPRKEIVE